MHEKGIERRIVFSENQVLSFFRMLLSVNQQDSAFMEKSYQALSLGPIPDVR
jgi:hypothetical protein